MSPKMLRILQKNFCISPPTNTWILSLHSSSTMEPYTKDDVFILGKVFKDEDYDGFYD